MNIRFPIPQVFVFVFTNSIYLRNSAKNFIRTQHFIFPLKMQAEKTRTATWSHIRAANGFTSATSRKAMCGEGQIAETATKRFQKVSPKKGEVLRNRRKARETFVRNTRRRRTGWCIEKVAERCIKGYRLTVSVSYWTTLSFLFYLDTPNVLSRCTR